MKPGLPPLYRWLLDEPGPRILVEALALYGTKEITGDESNPVILSWAHEIGGWVGNSYTDDDVPWCGLFVGVCALRAGFALERNVLTARAWTTWGQRADRPSLGDVLVFIRPGGGHVGFYVGEDDSTYHVLGGNQSNQVSISRIEKQRLLAARRCKWHGDKPDNVRPVILAGIGAVSRGES